MTSDFIPYLNRYTTASPDHEAAFDEFIGQIPPPGGAPLRLETRTEVFLRATCSLLDLDLVASGQVSIAPICWPSQLPGQVQFRHLDAHIRCWPRSTDGTRIARMGRINTNFTFDHPCPVKFEKGQPIFADP